MGKGTHASGTMVCPERTFFWYPGTYKCPDLAAFVQVVL